MKQNPSCLLSTVPFFFTWKDSRVNAETGMWFEGMEFKDIELEEAVAPPGSLAWTVEAGGLGHQEVRHEVDRDAGDKGVAKGQLVVHLASLQVVAGQ